jgi:hypothetical protein
MKTRLMCVSTVLSCLFAANASAQDVVTNTVRYDATWFTNALPVSFGVSLPKLNTNYSYFGTILSIEVGMFATNSIDLAIENNSLSAAVFSLKESGRMLITNPGPTPLSYFYFDEVLGQTNLAATDNNQVPNGSGPDYAFLDDLLVTGSSSGLVSASYYSLYLGAGAFEISGFASASFLAEGATPSTLSTSDPKVSGVAYVIYTYTLVPEPGAFIPLAGLGLGLVWWGRRRAGR